MKPRLLDPTGEFAAARRAPSDKPDTLQGLTVGLLDLSKARSDVFLDRIDELLSEHDVRTRRYVKPTFTRPAPTALLGEIASQCDVIVEALAD